MIRCIIPRVLFHMVLLVGLGMGCAAPSEEAGRYFAIQVVDEQTGRGVPMVELQTTSGIRYYTDSGGLIAFDEPGLMDRRVYFGISAHGYEYPPDGFGSRGIVLKTTPGETAVLAAVLVFLVLLMKRSAAEKGAHIAAE